MEHAEGSIVIDAPLEDVMEVIEDYESYPEWADVRIGRDPAARRGRTCHRGGLRGRRAGPGQRRPTPWPTDTHLATRALSWTTSEARGAIRDIRGEYLLHEVSDVQTKVTYRLGVELGVLVPGFLRSEGAKRVIENALEKLKRRVEMG